MSNNKENYNINLPINLINLIKTSKKKKEKNAGEPGWKKKKSVTIVDPSSGGSEIPKESQMCQDRGERARDDKFRRCPSIRGHECRRGWEGLITEATIDS